MIRDFTKCNVETVKIASLLTSMINIQPPVRGDVKKKVVFLVGTYHIWAEVENLASQQTIDGGTV